MSDVAPRALLRAIFESGSQGPASPWLEQQLPLPTLDERVDVYLLAAYGPDRATTAKERASARERILDAMAENEARKILDKDIAELTPAPASVWSTKRLWEACAGVFRRFLQLPSEAAEVFAIGSVRMATAGLVVLVGAAAVFAGSLIYFGSSFDRLSRNPQIASGPSSISDRSVALNTEQQIEEAARHANNEQSRQSVIDAQLKNNQHTSKLSDVATLPEQDLIAVQKRYAQLFAAGEYDRALIEAKKLEAASRSSFGENDLRYAGALGALAKVYVVQGRYSDAETVYKRMLAIGKNAAAIDRADLARALTDLAEVYRAQGRSTEAEELVNSALTIGGGAQQR